MVQSDYIHMNMIAEKRLFTFHHLVPLVIDMDLSTYIITIVNVVITSE
jgi:hypothetical protein